MIVLGVDMPHLDGISALKVIRDRNPAVTIIVASAEIRHRDPALDGGATTFVLKGHDTVAELERAVRAYVVARRGGADAAS